MRRGRQQGTARALVVAAAGVSAMCSIELWAQTHKVEKPQMVVRAVGVFEWTGDLTKPKASRLVPVSLYIDGQLEDAGIYQPRPIPFALTPGNAYELEQAGVGKGLVELSSAGKLPTDDTGYDNGWFGYGTFSPVPAEKPASKLRASQTISPITDRNGKSTGGGDSARKSVGDNESEKADPDRPTLRRRSTTGKTGTDAKGTATPTDATASSAPPDDADRPVLKKRGTDPAKAAPDTSTQREIATESLNNDPDRPNLHRGKPSGGGGREGVSVQLAGMPKDLQQMVAVSDAATRSTHDFTRAWADEAEHTAVLAKMEGLARAKLAEYHTSTGAKGSEAAAPIARSAPGKPATPAARRRAALAAAAAKRTAAAAPVLLGEDLKGYTLSYGGAPTYVYTAQTDGTGDALRYVTVVAQADAFGQLQPALSSVTDAAHLDRTPWMRLVGVVDAEASNRASLLFELREAGARQFALYRVVGARSEPIFTTGATQ